MLRDLPFSISLPLVQNPCLSIAESIEPENRSSPISAGPVKSNGQGSDDVELLKTSWQETWDELVSKTSTSSCAANPDHLPCFPIALPCGSKLYSPTLTGFIEQFLHRPLLDHCAQLIQDALLDSPSWSVRTQAACALLYLCARLLSYSALLPPSNRRAGCLPDASGILPGSEESASSEINENVSPTLADGKCLNDNEIDNPEMKEVIDVVQEWVSYAWNLVAQLTCKTLTSCKPWIGKVSGLLNPVVICFLALVVKECNLNKSPSC